MNNSKSTTTPSTPPTLHKRPPLPTYLKAYLPAIFWAGLIFWLSGQSRLPTSNEPWLNTLMMQTAHIVVYTMLYFWIWRALQMTLNFTDQSVSRKNQVLLWLLPLALTFFYALSDEFHQAFVPGREPSWLDIGFDMTGAIIAQLKLTANTTWYQKQT